MMIFLFLFSFFFVSIYSFSFVDCFVVSYRNLICAYVILCGTLQGPTNGKYATLSQQCKTLEANDYY